MARGRPTTRVGAKTTLSVQSVIQLAIVLGGVVAVGLPHPVTGLALVISVGLLAVLLFGRRR
jgi:hypothetical protein